MTTKKSVEKVADSTPSSGVNEDTVQSAIVGKTWEQQIQEELNRIKAESTERMREKGMLPFLKLPQGESEITILKEPIKNVTGKFGDRKQFAVMYKGEKYVLNVNPESPLYKGLLEALANGRTTVRIVKAGEGQQVRYSVI